jgi:microcin C transport system permease protein
MQTAMPPPPKKGRFALSPLNKRRWKNFTRNRRAYWSLWIFLFLFGASLFAEFLANDKPIMVSYRGEIRMPIFSFYSEQDYGGDFPTEAEYKDIEVRCLIETGGLETCFDDPEALVAAAQTGAIDDDGFQKGWLFWPPVPYSYNTIVDIPGVAPSPPDSNNWLGTDDTKRDVVARVSTAFACRSCLRLS